MKTAVLFIIFNRLEPARKVLTMIRHAKPERLLVVADGPRTTSSTDAEKCIAVRNMIDSEVDWPCVVERNYAKENMGCAKRVSSGLNWAFEKCDRLIVLEDDCLPHPTFFQYCEELLERYADDHRIGQICGSTRYQTRIKRESSYIVSRYGPIWGWASWRRAWRYYDFNMDSWPQTKAAGTLRPVCESDKEHALRSRLYDQLRCGLPYTWDYQWGYSKMINGLWSIIPSVNLVENIGFGLDATHTTNLMDGLRSQPMQFPLIHPTAVNRDHQFDRDYSRSFCGRPTIAGAARRFRNLISSVGKLTLPIRRHKQK